MFFIRCLFCSSYNKRGSDMKYFLLCRTVFKLLSFSLFLSAQRSEWTQWHTFIQLQQVSFFSLFSCSLIEAILGTITSSASKWSDLGYTYTNDRLRVKRLCSGWWSLKINEKKQIFNGCEKIVMKSFLSFHDFCMNPSNNSPVWVTEKRAYYGIIWYRWKSC